jgi:hypothetical protein
MTDDNNDPVHPSFAEVINYGADYGLVAERE